MYLYRARLSKDAPPLVLDEATAFIDPESEELIQQALRTCTWKDADCNRTQNSTVRNFDKIVVMDSGNIVAEGTHTDLLWFKWDSITACGSTYLLKRRTKNEPRLTA